MKIISISSTDTVSGGETDARGQTAGTCPKESKENVFPPLTTFRVRLGFQRVDDVLQRNVFTTP
jgi:hypothetical protein